MTSKPIAAIPRRRNSPDGGNVQAETLEREEAKQKEKSKPHKRCIAEDQKIPAAIHHEKSKERQPAEDPSRDHSWR